METEQPPTLQLNGTLMYTPRVFATAKNIPIQTVYSAVNSGAIVSHRFGGRVFLVASSADDYAEIYKASKESK